MKGIFAIGLLLPIQVLGLHFRFQVQELRNFLESELVPYLPNILSNVENIKPIMGMMKGNWPGLRILVSKSCDCWNLEVFQSLLRHIRHDSSIQSYLLSPACLQRLSFKLPLLKPEDGHCWLPPQGPSSVTELIDVIKHLPRIDPFGWYRADCLHDSLLDLLKISLPKDLNRIVSVDLKALLSWAPSLTKLEESHITWKDLLVQRFYSTKDDQERAAIFFYISHQTATDSKSMVSLFIKLKWCQDHGGNEEWQKLLQFLYCPKEVDTGVKIGIGENIDMEVFHLTVFMAIRHKYYALLLDLGTILRQRLAKYTPLDLSHLLRYMYEGYQIARTANFEISKAREFLGEDGIRRIIEEAYLLISWESAYFVLLGPERILNFRRWNYSSPKKEWRGISDNDYDYDYDEGTDAYENDEYESEYGSDYSDEGEDEDESGYADEDDKSKSGENNQDLSDENDTKALNQIGTTILRELVAGDYYNVPRNHPGTDLCKDLESLIQLIRKKLAPFDGTLFVRSNTSKSSLILGFNHELRLIYGEYIDLCWTLVHLTLYHQLHFSINTTGKDVSSGQVPTLEKVSTDLLLRAYDEEQRKTGHLFGLLSRSLLAIINNSFDTNRQTIEDAIYELTRAHHSNL